MSDATIRAERARQLLEDPLLIEALDAVESSAVDAIADADLSKFSALQAYAAELQAVRSVRQHLQSVVTTGTQAERSPQAVA